MNALPRRMTVIKMLSARIPMWPSLAPVNQDIKETD